MVLRPLDEEFVAALIGVTGATNLQIPRRENHFWRDQLRTLRQSLSRAQIAAFIAKQFNSGAWTDANAPTNSKLLQDVFAGYDRTTSAAVDDAAEQTGREEPSAARQAVVREGPEGRQRGAPAAPASPPPISATTTQQHPLKTPQNRRRNPTTLPTPGSTKGGESRQPSPTRTTPPNRPNVGSAPPVTPSPPVTPARRSLPTPRSSVGDMRLHARDVPDVVPAFLPPPEEQQSPALALGQDSFDDGSVPGPTRVDPKDRRGSHTFEGQRQPAIGTRLEHASNWATDEDINRRPGFAREKEELKRWLEYVDREHTLGENTLHKIDEVTRKIEAHDIFEQEHRHATMKTKISNLKDMKTRTQRIGNPNDLGYPPLQLGSVSREERNETLLPQMFGTHPRGWKPVNTMWDTPHEKSLDFEPKLNVARPDRVQALARDENAYWRTTPGTPPPGPEGNLSVLENQAYEDCKAFNEGISGWIHWDKEAGVRRLYTGDTPGNGEGCFANERGTRRAGLEAALRPLRNVENLLYATKSSALVALPPTAKEIAAAKRRAGADRGRLICGLPPYKLGKTEGKDDPQGFMANMAQFWVKQRAVVEQARQNLIADSKAFIKPPHSVWGPYIWRGVNMDDELKQDLLRQARAVKGIFDRERKIAPRQLLDQMNHFFEQGYSTHVGEPPYADAGDGGAYRVLNMNGLRNRTLATDELRRVDMIEMEWIRLILNNAMADERVLQDVQPRTSLFLLFAEKLERIFNDTSSPLFPEQDTSVSIEDLIAYMAKMEKDSPVRQPTFYPYDLKYWLERLHEQGRCRYRDDWRAYGWVQRPLYRYFPEQLIVWKDRRGDEVDVENFPEDAVFAPRLMEDLQPWAEVVRYDPPAKLNPAVETWFHQLAFRWGRTMRNLEARVWQDNVLPKAHLHDTLDQLDAEYQALAAPQKLDLAHVVRSTLGKPDNSAISEEEALQTIRDGVIDECVRSDGMLWPGRAVDYLDTSGPKTRESIWDWAKPEVRGRVKQFFSLDRWPVEVQPEAIQHRIKNGEDIDPQQVWNPITEDTTPWTYYRPKSRPYQNEPVRYKEGHRMFPIGDTPRQSQLVKDRLVAQVAAGMGLLDVNGDGRASASGGGVWSRVKSLGGLLSRKRRHAHDEDDDGDEDGDLRAAKLPRIDASLIPQSIDVASSRGGNQRP